MPEDLVTTGEISAMLGVSAQRADQLTRTKGFPDLEAEISTGGRKIRAWKRTDVESWAHSTGRRPPP